MSVDGSILESPLPESTQKAIATQFWPRQESQPQPLAPLGPYFSYYTEQCRIAVQAHGGHLPISSHQDVLSIASDMHTDLARPTIQDHVTQRCDLTDGPYSADAFAACIDLTLRLLLMIDVGDFRNAYSGRLKLLWTTGSVKEFLREKFPGDPRITDHAGLKLSAFNVCSLVRIAGFKVQLTDNLADHLRFRDADKTVAVFHHASFLQNQLQYANSNAKNCATFERLQANYWCIGSTSLFPSGLVAETLCTLALLFPEGDKDAERWYYKQDDSSDLDCRVLKCGPALRRIDEYRYWRDRLVILKEEFDESQPSTISQWWNDRREGMQWYTLWVAISLTVFFGLAQSIEGALQVYKAYHP